MVTSSSGMEVVELCRLRFGRRLYVDWPLLRLSVERARSFFETSSSYAHELLHFVESFFSGFVRGLFTFKVVQLVSFAA